MSENSTTPNPARLRFAETSNGGNVQNPGRLVGGGVSPYSNLNTIVLKCDYTLIPKIKDRRVTAQEYKRVHSLCNKLISLVSAVDEQMKKEAA